MNILKPLFNETVQQARSFAEQRLAWPGMRAVEAFSVDVFKFFAGLPPKPSSSPAIALQQSISTRSDTGRTIKTFEFKRANGQVEDLLVDVTDPERPLAMGQGLGFTPPLYKRKYEGVDLGAWVLLGGAVALATLPAWVSIDVFLALREHHEQRSRFSRDYLNSLERALSHEDRVLLDKAMSSAWQFSRKQQRKLGLERAAALLSACVRTTLSEQAAEGGQVVYEWRDALDHPVAQGVLDLSPVANCFIRVCGSVFEGEEALRLMGHCKEQADLRAVLQGGTG